MTCEKRLWSEVAGRAAGDRTRRAAIAAVGMVLAFMACKPKEEPANRSDVRSVKAVKAEAKMMPDVIEGFGSLNFKKKINISAPSEGMVKRLGVKEGKKVVKGQTIAELDNTQIRLGAQAAENSLESAKAAREVAEAGLLSQELAAEGRFLSLDKARMQIRQAELEIGETERKYIDQKKLLDAGGVTEESIRSAEFSLNQAKNNLEMMRKDFAVNQIGFRDEDIIAFGRKVPESEAERKRVLVEINTITYRAELDAAKAKVSSAQRELESSKSLLAELVLKAPQAGTVGAVNVEEGERVKANDTVMTIMDVDSLYAVIPVREEEAVRISADMKATVVIDALKGAAFSGAVELVAPIADSQAGSLSVRILISDKAGKLKPGMFARASIVVGPPRRAIFMPARCMLDRKADSARILVVSGKTVSSRDVKLGKEGEDGFEVLSGLQDGELVLDYPDPTLRDGDKVEVR